MFALFAVGDVYASLCKKALTLHLARSEGHERYFRCNLMHCKVLASFHQHLTAEAPTLHRPADSALPRTMSSTGSKACQLSTINPNDSRVSNPLVSRGRCTT